MLILFNLLSFLLPTQLGLHLNFLNQTVFGFRIDYLIPTIYLTDVVILLIILFNLKKIKIKLVPTVLFIVFILINVYLSSFKIASIYKWIKLVEIIFLGIIILKEKRFKVFDNFIKPLSYSIFIICILGILEWIFGKSIGGPFYFFGERNFILGDPGISSFNLIGVEMLRPYSTFSHPNSFAGFLLVFSIFLINFKKKFNPKYFNILLLLILVNLFLTFSSNVFITILLLIIVYINPTLNYALFVIDFGSRSFLHRVELINSSIQLIKENFMFGIGLNNFVPNLVLISNKFLSSWELQPVHNIYLLIFSELGLIGIVSFIYLIIKTLQSTKESKYLQYCLYAILITGLFDHYWFTLQQNILLFTFVLALSLNLKRK